MGFLGIGAMEALVIIVAALIIFGPGRLPEVMGQAGRFLRDLRRASQELTGDFRESIDEVRQTYDELEADMRDTARELRNESNQIAREVNTAVSDATKGTAETRSSARRRPAQKLDQMDVAAAAGDPAVDAKPARPSSTRKASKPAPAAEPPRRTSTFEPADDLLAVEDSEEDLLSMNGTHELARSEPPASD